MQYYRCECGESEFYGSDSPRPCMGCDECGTTYAQSPTGHRPRESHQWRPRFPAQHRRPGLHRVMEPVTVPASGTTPAFEVMPALRRGTEVGASVTLIHAYALFNVESISASRSSPTRQVVTFSGSEALV